MAADYILLDTCVLSDARKQRPPPEIAEFIGSLQGTNVAIASASIFELARGALDLSKQNAELSRERMTWLKRLLSTNLYFIAADAGVKQLMAEMSLFPSLKNFWVNDGKSKKLHFGSDPEIAAVSILHEIPIATSNIRDFLLINEHFPIPGLYDPRQDEWHLEPPPGWRIASPANGNVRDARWNALFPMADRKMPGA